MIVNDHPTLKLLEEMPWKAHLVGSRYVGAAGAVNPDYDFLVECAVGDWHGGLKSWLLDAGFKAADGGAPYGPDTYMHGTNVWTKEVSGFPSVDVLPVSPKEAERRLKVFRAMRKMGHESGGVLAKALKRGNAWPNLWDCLRGFEE